MMLITSSSNLKYLTGYTGEGIALITDSHNLLYVDGRYTLVARAEAPDFEVVTTDKPFDEIKKFNLKSLGVEKKHLSVARFETIKAKLEIENFTDISNELSVRRAIKTPAELEKIANAAKIANQAYRHIESKIVPGMTEKEVALELEFFMRKNGADDVSFDAIVASGERSALPHAVPTDNPIPENGYVLLDFGCKFEGYCSDMTRMIPLGEISSKMREIYKIVQDAQAAALAKVFEGVRACDVDKAARDVIENAGYSNNFTHSTGHGVGLDVHENPAISSKNETVLKSGMVITIEPGIYLEGIGGVRIEDMVCVTEDGYHNFSVGKA